MCGGGGDQPDPLQETPAEQEASRVAIERWNDYQKRFRPLENQLMQDVRTTDAEMERGLGQANAASAQQFDQAQERQQQGMMAHGINPNSGAFTGRTGQLGLNQAQSAGLNMAGMGQALEDQERRGLMGVVAMGQGQSTNAFQNFGQQANAAQQQAASDAKAALNDVISRQQAIGTGLGLAASGLANANFFKSSPGGGGQGVQLASAPDPYVQAGTNARTGNVGMNYRASQPQLFQAPSYLNQNFSL